MSLFVETPIAVCRACLWVKWVDVRVCQVLTETIPLDPAFDEALNDRLVLVFTGKQRLARSVKSMV